MTADYPDWMPVSQQMLAAYADVSGQIAALIATGSAAGAPGGVPLLTYANSLVSGYSGSVTGTGVVFPSTGVFSVSQIGYDGTITLSSASAGQQYLQVFMQWYMSGVLMAEDTFNIAAPTSPGTSTVHFRGPSKGNQLVITIFDNNTGSIAVTNFSFQENSRIYAYDLWRTVANTTLAFPVATMINNDVPSGLLGWTSASVGSGLTESFLLPLYTGKCNIAINTASGTSDCHAFITNVAEPFITSSLPFNQNTDTTGKIALQDFYMPRSQCEISLVNGNAAAKVLNFCLTAADY